MIARRCQVQDSSEVMRNTITHILIACLLAISLHGFGTDEHVFTADIGDSVMISDDASEGGQKPDIPRLGAACDICQVVHQYVILDAGNTIMPASRGVFYARPFHGPPLAITDEILHPPTI